MRAPEELRVRLASTWAARRREWLQGEGTWPWRLKAGEARRDDLRDRWSAFDSWLRAWRSLSTRGHVQYKVKSFGPWGTHEVPDEWRFDTPEQVADELGEGLRWRQARERFVELSQWQDDGEASLSWRRGLARRFDVLADLPPEEFMRLCAVVKWLWQHPASHLYPRQLPIAGMDSKWVEKHGKLVAHWVAALRGMVSGDFYEVTGLRAMPDRLRMRILDDALREHWHGLSDIEAPVAEFAALKRFHPACVMMVENLTTGLAFEDLPGTVVFMRRGYAVEALARLPWMKDVPVLYYWGDLDTHGLHILHRLRAHVPTVKSLMMDDLSAFEAFGELAIHEPAPSAALSLPNLTGEEQRMYRRLKAGRLEGDDVDIRGLRLEQERLAWPWAWMKVRAAVTP